MQQSEGEAEAEAEGGELDHGSCGKGRGSWAGSCGRGNGAEATVSDVEAGGCADGWIAQEIRKGGGMVSGAPGVSVWWLVVPSMVHEDRETSGRMVCRASPVLFWNSGYTPPRWLFPVRPQQQCELGTPRSALCTGVEVNGCCSRRQKEEDTYKQEEAVVGRGVRRVGCLSDSVPQMRR